MGDLTMTDDTTFADLLREITHDGFMAMTWLFVGMSLLVVGMALHRLVPRRAVNPLVDEDVAR